MAHPKGLLMERLKKLGVGKPEFRTANTGPDHQPTFLSDVLVDGEVYGTGQGSTKRDAERLAAEEALRYLERDSLDLDEPERGSRKQRSGQPGSRDNGSSERDSGRHDLRQHDLRQHGLRQRGTREPAVETAADDGFEGPWPVFESLLATTLQVANDRTDARLAGDEAREAVREFALDLYKELLQDLGDIVDVADDEEE